MSQSSIPMFIAEVSANHLGSLDRARDIVKAAAAAGADTVAVVPSEGQGADADATSPFTCTMLDGSVAARLPSRFPCGPATAVVAAAQLGRAACA